MLKSNKTFTPAKNSVIAPTGSNLLHQNIKNDRFRFIFETWNTMGCTSELVDMLKLCEQGRWCWRNDNPEVFLIYVCCLLEIGNKSEAKRVLKKYIENIGCEQIWKYMPAAQLFAEMGYKDFTIEKSAFVFSKLEKNRGAEIDSHDIVIRMNNFYIDGYERDYGKKTNIWVRNAHRVLRDRDIIDEIDYILWEADYWHIFIQYDHLNLMYRDILIAENKLGYMYGLHKEVCSHSSVLNPTTGMQLVYFLEKNKHLFKKLDYYGFSFLDPSSDTLYSHYYNEPTTAQKDHQPSIEINYMRELVSGNQQTEFKSQLHETQLFKIYACAFRKYDINKGHTGGPSGVLAMQRTIFGDGYKSCPIQYLFLPSKITYPPEVTEQINSVSGKLKGVLQGIYYIQSHPEIKRDLDKHITPVLLCHDLGTAYGAFLSGLKYSIVYHQQGSILNEMLATGVVPTEEEIKLMNKIERRTMEHAVSVYFPSMGAKQVLINTSENVAVAKGIPFADFALYNTIPNVAVEDDSDDLLKEIGIQEIDRSASEVFFSCGDFNYDKGMERIPAFLTEYAKHSNKKIIWIAIGNAGAHDIFNQLNSEKEKWPFSSYLFGKRIDHAILLALMKFCDYYIMLHRNSIFDLATLEAMRAGANLILSPTGGNLEFNVENNVVYVGENFSSAINEICSRDKKVWSESNIKAFNDHFSHKEFAKNYSKALDFLLYEAGFVSPAQLPAADS